MAQKEERAARTVKTKTTNRKPKSASQPKVEAEPVGEVIVEEKVKKAPKHRGSVLTHPFDPDRVINRTQLIVELYLRGYRSVENVPHPHDKAWKGPFEDWDEKITAYDGKEVYKYSRKGVQTIINEICEKVRNNPEMQNVANVDSPTLRIALSSAGLTGTPTDRHWNDVDILRMTAEVQAKLDKDAKKGERREERQRAATQKSIIKERLMREGSKNSE